MRANRTPGSVRGAPGNRCPYLDGGRVNLFLDASVVLAACGRPTGASRAVFD